MRRRSTPGRGGRWANIARLIAGAVIALFAATAPSRAEAGDEVKVVVTIKPIHSIVAQLLAGIAVPTLLVDGAASPHSFALRPSQVRAAAAAGVVIRVSERLEPFTARLMRTLPEDVRVVTLIEAPGVHLLSRREHLDFEQHDHDHGAHRAHGEEDADSHIWLDPDNAKAIAAHLAGVLGERYPQHAATLAANGMRVAEELDSLTRELVATTAPLAGKPFVVFHDAYQYFDRRFDLDAVGSITVSPEVQPSAKRLSQLRRRIRSLGAVCVFAEPQFQPGVVSALTEDTQARSGTLDPEGRMLEPGPQLYATLMRALAADLKSCLAPRAAAESKRGSAGAAP